MFSAIVDFANLMIAALVVGAMFGVWLAFNPTGLDAAAYLTQQQRAVRAFNTALPILGGLALILTLAAAALARAQSGRFTLLLIAGAAFLTAGFITRFLSQPINATMMTWSAAAPPAEWTSLRDSWWRWHLVRLSAGLIALACIAASALQRGQTA